MVERTTETYGRARRSSYGGGKVDRPLEEAFERWMLGERRKWLCKMRSGV